MPKCNDCESELLDSNHIAISTLTVFDKVKGAGTINNLHFCNPKCCNSWLVKNVDRPSIVIPLASKRGINGSTTL